MKHLTFTSLLVLLSFTASLFAQVPDTIWTYTFGEESYDDVGYSVQLVDGGNYLITGYTESYGAGGRDVCLIKTIWLGWEIWSQTFGGEADDVGTVAQQTTDGGYVIFAYTESYGAGMQDAYLIKTDVYGNEIWSHTFGGSANDSCACGQQTTDGGYILTGTTDSFGAGQNDVYLIKTDAEGNEVWSQTFGGSENDGGNSVQQISDGGYIIAGYTESYGAGDRNIYLIKTDSLGNEVWYQTFWDDGQYTGKCVQQTPDGGYIVLVEVTGFMYWGARLLKTDGAGNESWFQHFNGTAPIPFGALMANSVTQTSDGGYALTGRDSGDILLLKTDPLGNEVWRVDHWSMPGHCGQSIMQMTDGGFIIAGQSSWTLCDVSLIRYDDEGSCMFLTLTPALTPGYPNIPAGGGDIEFEIEIVNGGTTTRIVDVWTDITLPGGYNYPIILRENITFEPWQNFTREDLIQYVPGTAIPGDYSYNAYVRDHSTWEVLDSDSFPFTKLEGDEGENHDFGWALFGWDEEETIRPSMPTEMVLLGAYPNPFNPLTSISFSLPEAAHVKLTVFDLQGRMVAELVNGMRDASNHTVTWDASHLASGLYFYRIEAGDFTSVKKMVLMK